MIEEIKTELSLMQRLGLISRLTCRRCFDYLESNGHEFDPSITGPLSVSDAADLLIDLV